ncbi:MAG: hypothetical protein L3K10_00795 [Thermoplasmata archaeon]|nr:hypothetical protein [Thermoplasmata archaeon]
MSENGPREGTRDLPRSSPEAGRRAMDGGSASGAAYQAIARRARRRREEIIALVRSGLPFEQAAETYSRDHPLEHQVPLSEVAAAVASHKDRHPRARPVDG